MNIPTFYTLQNITQDGKFTPPVANFFDQLVSEMQNNLSNGFSIPNMSTEEISSAANNLNANTKPNGTVWYDSTTNQLKVKQNGVVRTITTA